MKFNCGPTLQEKIKARKEWHDWFAWYPVRIAVTLGSSDCRWLETVERRGEHNWDYDGGSYWDYEYRAKGETE